MFSLRRTAGAAALVGCSVVTLMAACGDDGPAGPEPPDPALAAEGKDIFRFDTYGDETFWTDTLRLHEVIQAAVDPTTALAVGLKVDAAALPAEVFRESGSKVRCSGRDSPSSGGLRLPPCAPHLLLLESHGWATRAAVRARDAQ
jgi:hypothetical protein